MKISKQVQDFLDKCDAIEMLNKIADEIISELAPDIHIDIDLSRYENALKQHQFSH